MQRGEAIDVDGSSGALDLDAASGEAPSQIELWQVNATTFETRELITPGN
jgi:branched-chain amino acid transport system substrate-binding protein